MSHNYICETPQNDNDICAQNAIQIQSGMRDNKTSKTGGELSPRLNFSAQVLYNIGSHNHVKQKGTFPLFTSEYSKQRWGSVVAPNCCGKEVETQGSKWNYDVNFIVKCNECKFSYVYTVSSIHWKIYWENGLFGADDLIYKLEQGVVYAWNEFQWKRDYKAATERISRDQRESSFLDNEINLKFSSLAEMAYQINEK